MTTHRLELPPTRFSITSICEYAKRFHERSQNLLAFEVLAPFVMLITGFGLWQYALATIDISKVGQFGLLPQLPIAFFLALGFVVYSFVYTLTRATKHPWLLCAHIGLLVFILHGSAPAVFHEPRYPWVYKHFGVVDYIETNGSVNTNIDIYQNWPAFFAGAAWLSRLMGLDVIRYAAWAQVFFNLVYFLELTFIYQALNVGYRVRWLALFFFFSTNWVGQDYFSPQGFSLVLCLAIFGIVLGWLRSDFHGPIAFLVRKCSPVRGSTLALSDGPSNTYGWRNFVRRPWMAKSASRFAPLLIALGLFTVVVVAHQLSPYMVIVAVVLLTLLGGIKPWWFVGAMGAIALSYVALHYEFLVHNFGPLLSGGDPFSNAQTNGQTATPDAGVSLVANTTRVLAICLWLLGGAGFIRRLRNGHRDLTIGVLAVSPFFILGGQNYGGEAIFRVYLFGLPWFSALAAYAVLPRRIKVSARFITLRSIVLVIGLGLFLVSYFGLEEIYEVTPNEVVAMNYFYDNAPANSVLFETGDGLPLEGNARYSLFAVTGLPTSLSNHVPGPADLPAIDNAVDSYNSGAPAEFFVFSNSAVAYAHAYGQLPDGWISSLQTLLAKDPGWRLWYKNQDVVFYERVK